MKPLFERYRPILPTEVVGQPKAVAAIMRLWGGPGLAGRAYWFAGPSGTGKTTLAKIIASDVADPINIDELDASGLTPKDIQEIERHSHVYGLGQRNGRAYIINEAHGLRRDTVRQLLTTLERIPRHVVWIFTTTDDGQEKLFDGMDGHPLFSRCIELPMSRSGLTEAFATRAREIALAEGLDGQPAEAYIDLVNRKRNNFRAVLNEIEAGAMIQ